MIDSYPIINYYYYTSSHKYKIRLMFINTCKKNKIYNTFFL